MAGLSDIVKGVQRTNELLADNVNANKRTAAMITAFVTGQKANFGDRLEASGEKGKGKTATKAAAPARPVKGSGGISGIAAKPTGLLGKLAGMLGGVGAALKGGIGIAAIGAGIAAFFTALGAGDMALEKMKATGEWLSGFMGQISGAIAVMIKDGSAKALAGVFAAGALFGMVTGVRGKVKAVVGIAAIGLGISAFFTALGAGDMALEAMQTTGTWLGGFITNIAGAINTLIDTNAGVVLAGILLTGGLFGAVAGPRRTLKAAFGIAMIGAGIAGFFTALGGGEMALTAMEATGERLGGFMTNIAEGMKAFTGPTGAVILGLIAAGGIFGVKMLGPAIGIAGMGVAIGAFFTGIAAGDAIISFMSGLTGSEPGEGFKLLMINTAGGIQAFADINVDPEKIKNIALALPALVAAMLVFFGTSGFAKLSGLMNDIVDAGLGAINKLFGTSIGEGETNPIRLLVDGLKPLNELDSGLIGQMERFTKAIDAFFESFKRIAQFDHTASFSNSIFKIMMDMGRAMRLLPVLINGGDITADDATWANNLFGQRTTNFGQGLKGLQEADLLVLREGIKSVREAFMFNEENMTPIPEAPVVIPGSQYQNPAFANPMPNFQTQNSFTPITIVNGPMGDPITRDQLGKMLPNF